MEQLRAVQQFNITDRVCGVKYTTTAFACKLTGCIWETLSGSALLSWWGCTSAARPVAERRRTSAPGRSVPGPRRCSSAAKQEAKLHENPSVVFFLGGGLVKCITSLCRAIQAAVHPPLSWNKLFSTFVAWDPFKGMQFPVPNEGLGSTKWWTLRRKND